MPTALAPPGVPTCPPDLSARSADLGLGAWAAGVRGLADYWGSAIARAATPFDVAMDMTRWWEAVSRRERPTWSTPNQVIGEWPVARLRDFSQGDRTDVVPTLVLPPQAGHDSCIVDYSEHQSQMQTIRAAGLTRAYSLDWIGATPTTKHSTIDTYLEAIEASVEQIGGPVNLIGDCQGGWLAAIYAALHPEQVNTLTLAGAPIDFHAGEPLIGAWVDALAPNRDLTFYENLVRLGDGVYKGEWMLTGFIMMQPDSEVSRQLALLGHLDDTAHMDRYRAFEDWFKYTQDIPGDFYLWIVEHLFRDNELVHGELEVGGKLVDMKAIKCPLFLMAGETDHITPAAQVFIDARYVGTPRKLITSRLASGGHLGLFMGSEALRDHWPPLLAGVARHSGVDEAVLAAVPSPAPVDDVAMAF